MLMIKKEDAIWVLNENISSVRTVKDWATLIGYDSEKYFSRKIRNTLGKRPKELIIEMKILKIHECVSKSPDDIYYCVAKRFGFEDDNALYKFLKRHTGKCLTELKKEKHLTIITHKRAS